MRGFTARYYETLLNIATFGGYRLFIDRVVRDIKIKPSDQIIDFGAGTGYNDCFILKYLSNEGRIVGLEIGEVMISRFKKRCNKYPNVGIQRMRIDKSLPFSDEFNKVLISFVLHGFPHETRMAVIKNALKVLSLGGELFILDYGEFSCNEMPFYFRIPFRAIECKYAYDYLKRDWKKILLEYGFSATEEIVYLNGFVRLLKAVK